MGLFRFLLARSGRTLVVAIGAGLVSGALNSSLLALVNFAILHQEGINFALIIAFAALCVFSALARVTSELLLVRMGQSTVCSLRIELSRQVLSVPLRQLEQVGGHRVLSVLSDDIPNIINMVVVIPVLCINASVVAGCLVYMGWLHWKLLMVVLGLMAVGILTYQMGVARAVQHFSRAREHENQLQKHFQALVHGIKELMLHRPRRDTFLSSVLGKTAEAARDENNSALTVYTLASSWGQLLIFVIIGLVVLYIGHALGTSGHVITGFALALVYLTTPLQVIINSLPGMARANVAIDNVQELGLELGRSVTSEESATATEPRSTGVRLELADVTYSYLREDSPSDFILGPINLTVEPGELLFVTGGNGCGKTTLAKLITGLYAPDTGKIYSNEIPVTGNNRDGYRQQFSAVFFDFFLFDALIGLEDFRLDDRAREYLSNLHLTHKVCIENGKFSTTQLSQGQRKRLALLTCYLEDRPICFFDEWAADQDPAFKEVFYLSILPALKAQGRTVIVISHDDRYYWVADRVIKLESGQLISSPVALSLDPASS
jgi:putative ATP-binding cassette transporter